MFPGARPRCNEGDGGGASETGSGIPQGCGGEG